MSKDKPLDSSSPSSGEDDLDPEKAKIKEKEKLVFKISNYFLNKSIQYFYLNQR